MPDEKSRTFGYRQEVLEAFVKLLAPFDDVTRDNMFGFPSFRASGQIFACIYEQGFSLKMPKAASEAIVQSPGISPFIPFGRARMRQWIHIERKNIAALKKDFPLIEASIHYVRTLKSRPAGDKSPGAGPAKKWTDGKSGVGRTPASPSPAKPVKPAKPVTAKGKASSPSNPAGAKSSAAGKTAKPAAAKAAKKPATKPAATKKPTAKKGGPGGKKAKPSAPKKKSPAKKGAKKKAARSPKPAPKKAPKKATKKASKKSAAKRRR